MVINKPKFDKISLCIDIIQSKVIFETNINAVINTIHPLSIYTISNKNVSPETVKIRVHTFSSSLRVYICIKNFHIILRPHSSKLGKISTTKYNQLLKDQLSPGHS